MSSNQIQTPQDYTAITDLHRSINQRVSQDLTRIIDDERFSQVVYESTLNDMIGFVSPQRALTYFSTPELIYANQRKLEGIIQIRSCYVDERRFQDHFLLEGIRDMGTNQLRNSQKGFRETLILENGIRINSPLQTEKKPGFIARLTGGG